MMPTGKNPDTCGYRGKKRTEELDECTSVKTEYCPYRQIFGFDYFCKYRLKNGTGQPDQTNSLCPENQHEQRNK